MKYIYTLTVKIRSEVIFARHAKHMWTLKNYEIFYLNNQKNVEQKKSPA